MEDSSVPVEAGLGVALLVSGQCAAFTVAASLGRLTAGLLRAATIALHVGLGSSCFVNSMRT